MSENNYQQKLPYFRYKVKFMGNWLGSKKEGLLFGLYLLII